jgi:hypothetical protein
MGTVEFRRPVAVALIFFALAFVNFRLVAALVAARGEQNALAAKERALAARHGRVKDDFILRQDHMRRMLTDGDFMKQIVRKKVGYIGSRETVFKFED